MGKIDSPTVHLSAEQLEQHVWDGVPLSAEAAMHLSLCPQCSQELAMLRKLAGELRIVQRSQPSPAALARYQQLFALHAPQPSRMDRLMTWVRANLVWDSRRTLALQGIRSAARPSYRLIYTTTTSDVELLVTPYPTTFGIEGEFLVAGNALSARALIQLQSENKSNTVLETEATAGGRFRLDHVAPGLYTLWITPEQGAALEIRGLELL
ncbi:MAG: hypothetical protein DCC55_17890 [Chloroflexi bacterium]|nr:MAG: hypothetical protein DCC55_17890 [Chloroflexota bacterium]